MVIRPMAFCKEEDLARYAEALECPIIPCNLCGSQETLQRQAIKQMLHEWERQYPGRVENIFRSIRNVSPSQLADINLFNFSELTIDRAEAPVEMQQQLITPVLQQS